MLLFITITSIDRDIEVFVSRNGQLEQFKLHVDDIIETQIKKYINFAGANFHEITNLTRTFLSSNIVGIYQTSATPVSVFKRGTMPNVIKIIKLNRQ